VLSTNFTFWFHLFRSADKIYEDEPVVHLVLSPPSQQRDGKDNFIPWPFYIHWFAAPPPPPILRSYWLAQRHTTPILPSYWLAQRLTTAHYAVTFLSVLGRGGTGITSPQLGWQRSQRILVLVILMPHMENGQGQNHPCFLYLFLYCQNHREKLILWARNWVH
jgi:hypothetical protein